MASYGMLILGPSQHFWFNYMSKILPKRDTLTTLKKLFMGQAIYGPSITAVFFSYNASLQGIFFLFIRYHIVTTYRCYFFYFLRVSGPTMAIHIDFKTV